MCNLVVVDTMHDRQHARDFDRPECTRMVLRQVLSVSPDVQLDVDRWACLCWAASHLNDLAALVHTWHDMVVLLPPAVA